ncbi:hypothetical protein DFA_06405 [Cavenderia fasciculata]|uniref:Amidohydrolase-related domain-containing protein n=1 Tax=Cavenderia fasciculata TaxID=261658 RepID=F4PIW9_CACFS|nr:uncharacterized protein DFA_06405 [Cavenderia fasciculata]EGG24255.1 hypothetical protein DFA_06405 [Cavenderia fasciculata]|eukprot:XP_004362106.1 hypothetical protein DFA_06405 [Cavenderia fasciculata]
MTIKQAIRGKQVLVAGEETFRECTLLIDQDGVVSEIKEYQYALPDGVELIRDCADNEVLMGALVNIHVQVTDSLHLATHTAVAAAGGVTTIIYKSLTTASFDHLSMECYVDVGTLYKSEININDRVNVDKKKLESDVDVDFIKEPGSISSLQYGLSIVWTEYKKRGIPNPMYHLTECMCDAPARLANLNDKKGSIAVGRDADFVVFDPDQSFTFKDEGNVVGGSATLTGVILETILRGQTIDNVMTGGLTTKPHGECIVPTNIHSNPSYPSPYLPPITRLNQMGRDNFFNVVHLLFETAPPLANALYDARPFSSYNNLIDVADTIIQKCSDQDKILIINAHPRIGVNPAATKTSQSTPLSTLSFREQGCHSEQINDEVQRVYQSLQQLNEQYEKKNGFKFVVFVAGRPKSEIVKVLEQRLQNNTIDELRIGLTDMTAIARDRLKKLVKIK